MRGQFHRLAFQVLLSAGFLLILGWRIDIPEAVDRLRSVNMAWVALAGIVFTVAHAIGGYRWRLILAHQPRIRLRELVLIFYISRLVNMLIPFRGGDIARIQIAANRFQVSRAELAGTVFGVETPLNWLTMFVVLAVTLLFVDVPLIPGRVIAATTLVLVTAFVTAAFVSETWSPGDLTKRRGFRLLPERPVRTLSWMLGQFIDGMRSLRTPGRAVRVFVVSLLVFFSEGLVFVCLGQAFGLDLPLHAYIVVLMAPNLIRTLPLTPGDIGPYELAMTEVVALLGESQGVAGSFAVGSHLLILLWTAILGLVSTWALNLRANDLVHIQTAPPDPDELPHNRSA